MPDQDLGDAYAVVLFFHGFMPLSDGWTVIVKSTLFLFVSFF